MKKLSSKAPYFLGVLFLSLLVLTVPRISVVGASVATITGQLLNGILIDHFGMVGKHTPLDSSRYVVMVLLVIAVIAITRSHKVEVKKVLSPEFASC